MTVTRPGYDCRMTDEPVATDATAIRTSELTRRFGDQTVVDSIDLEVRTGEIFGLLGPNGSGKSTTLRMLTGLIEPTSGDVAVLGSRPGTVPQRVGAVIEEPAVYPYLTGRRNLELLAKLVGAPADAVDEHLETIGLASAGDRPAGSYSTGMRQRLGIAAALVHDPELLLLDEPSAGLDPSGMVEIRELLERLADGTRTIVVSSHLLTEIDQICDRVAIIHRGQLVFQGELDELHQRDEQELRARVHPTETAIDVLDDLGVDVHAADDDELVMGAAVDRTPEIVRALVAADVDVFEIGERRRTLEEAYMEVTTS